VCDPTSRPVIVEGAVPFEVPSIEILAPDGDEDIYSAPVITTDVGCLRIIFTVPKALSFKESTARMVYVPSGVHPKSGGMS
jgi:hypothetical protein